MSTVIASYLLTDSAVLEIAQGDLTQEPLDAIVNAANEHLHHGAGVAAAISSAGGPDIQRESDAWVRAHGPVAHASPAYTGAGKMPSKYVIHAVGPVWGAGDEDRKLGDAIAGSLRVAERLGLVSIAFPAISTGIFGFPLERAAGVFIETFIAYFREHPDSRVRLVRLTLFDGKTASAFRQAAEKAFTIP